MKLLMIAGAANVNECPNLIKQDEDMAKVMPGDEVTMVKVDQQIALSKMEQEVGNHDASMAAAGEARTLPGM